VSSADKVRVLLVYSRVGGGHLSAARALAEELEATGRAATHLIDIYVECGRFPVTTFPGVYAELARHHPRVWSMIFNASGLPWLNPARVLGPFLRSGLARALGALRPAVVVSVLPAINGLLVEAAQPSQARVEVVLTDWAGVHPLWFANGVRQYTVPTDVAARDCVRVGATPSTVDIVGIPVRRTFAEAGARERADVKRACLPQLGLDPDRFTVLAMVGAEGSPRALQNIAHVLNTPLDAQVVVVCAHNAALRAAVQRLPSRVPVHALGFVDNVADLMRSADVLITKAGGLTLAEAFCCEVPVVVNDVLPGQEAGNVAYAREHGAVEYAPGPAQLAALVAELRSDARRRARLIANAQALARPQAAQQIARAILARCARG
jgi:UDP-N-acetylglucosamine:LPS N-acetylglucosamine transferase